MELQESEEKYRSFINRANDAIVVVQDGVIKMCNPRLGDYWGGAPDGMVGRPFTEFVHSDNLSKLVDNYKRRIAGESFPSIYETTLMNRDGGRSFVELNAGVIVYEGRPADLVIIRDITDRKKAEDSLRESEATARALINAPTDSVILTDSQGVILALNETAASRFGRRPDELVGVLADDLLPKKVAQSRRLLMSTVIEKKTMVRFEDERDGRWYDTVAYPVMSGYKEVTRIAIISRDITDRKNTEKALVQSEDRYRQLVDISPDAVLLHTKGKIIFANPAALKLLGASHAAEIIGKNVIDFIQPEFRAAVRKNIEKDLGGEITPHMELHMVGIDGTQVIVEGRGVKTTMNGEAAIQVALRDITERKRSTDALLESEKRLRLILDSTDDLVIVQDPEGRYLYFNSAARYGVSGEEMIGSTPFDFIDRESADRIVKRVKKVVRTGQRIREETPIVWKGQTLWFSDSLAPMRNANGTITAVVTISQNITERKHAEMALHESEQMFRRLLEQSFDAIAIHKDNKIAFLNERAGEILGASKSEDLIGRSIFEFIHPDSRKDLEDRIRQMAAAPDDPVPVMREKFFRMDGTVATVDVMAMRFKDNGVPAVRVAFREVNSH
jgi:PAS domain S-box-containing protein